MAPIAHEAIAGIERLVDDVIALVEGPGFPEVGLQPGVLDRDHEGRLIGLVVVRIPHTRWSGEGCFQRCRKPSVGDQVEGVGVGTGAARFAAVEAGDGVHLVAA